MKKKCIKCKKVKNLEDFALNKTRSDGRHNQCKKCKNQYNKDNYLKNKSKIIDSNKRRKEKVKQFIIDYKKGKKCVDCGIEYASYVMDFDHVRGKKLFSIGHSAFHCCSIEKIKKEIKKCEIRCANCHRIRTHSSIGRASDS